jgi:group I intron endonuclease
MEYTIYKIICKDENIKDCYIGSTKNFHRRKLEHKNSYNTINQNSNCNVYKFIRDNGGWDNFIFDIVETLICENKNDALIRERYWVENLDAKINSKSPYKRYDENHSKTWRLKTGKITCDCGLILSKTNLLRHTKSKKHQDYLLSLSSDL